MSRTLEARWRRITSEQAFCKNYTFSFDSWGKIQHDSIEKNASNIKSMVEKPTKGLFTAWTILVEKWYKEAKGGQKRPFLPPPYDFFNLKVSTSYKRVLRVSRLIYYSMRICWEEQKHYYIHISDFTESWKKSYTKNIPIFKT